MVDQREALPQDVFSKNLCQLMETQKLRSYAGVSVKQQSFTAIIGQPRANRRPAAIQSSPIPATKPTPPILNLISTF